MVREAAVRVLGQRHYDVQLVGGAALHWGAVAEMRTGEGKTLTSTLPVYLTGITGRGVHVVTVNDYLAGRDAEWMGQLYKWLGLSVGLVVPGNRSTEFKRAQYACDVTYGTNNELASTTCATTWPWPGPSRSSGATTTASWTRSTRSSSTRPAPR